MSQQEKEQYDFIYIDGSHQSMERFADVLLAWPLLKSGGILGINDYRFIEENMETTNNSIQPIEGVVMKHVMDMFMKMIKSEMKVVSSEYRLFLRKI